MEIGTVEATSQASFAHNNQNVKGALPIRNTSSDTLSTYQVRIQPC